MPSKLKKRQRINKDKLGHWELRYLMRGCSLFPIDNSDKRMKPLWEKHRDYLMAFYTDGQQYTGDDDTMSRVLTQTEHGPGKRPWGWWKWEAKEKLQEKEACTSYYAPSCWSCKRDYKDQYMLARYCKKVEPQLEYLTRLNLLTEKEKQLLSEEAINQSGKENE